MNHTKPDGTEPLTAFERFDREQDLQRSRRDEVLPPPPEEDPFPLSRDKTPTLRMPMPSPELIAEARREEEAQYGPGGYGSLPEAKEARSIIERVQAQTRVLPPWEALGGYPPVASRELQHALSLAEENAELSEEVLTHLEAIKKELDKAYRFVLVLIVAASIALVVMTLLRVA